MEGIKHFTHPVPLSNATVALIVLGISVALEAFSLHGAMTEIRKISGGKPFIKWFRETRQSELMVIAGEDIAALAGLGIAFVAVLTTVVTGNPLWDACGSIAVGILLMVVAIIITREVKAMITGESAAPEVHAAIKSHIEGRPEVEPVIHLIMLQWGGVIDGRGTGKNAAPIFRHRFGRRHQCGGTKHTEALAAGKMVFLRT